MMFSKMYLRLFLTNSILFLEKETTSDSRNHTCICEGSILLYHKGILDSIKTKISACVCYAETDTQHF